MRLVQSPWTASRCNGLSGWDAKRLQQIGALVAQDLLRDQALHTFHAKDLTVGSKEHIVTTDSATG